MIGPHEKRIAGFRCGDVLARLGDYVDDELVAEERARFEEHVRGCTECSQFGGVFGRVVASLRRASLGEMGVGHVDGVVARALRAAACGEPDKD